MSNANDLASTTIFETERLIIRAWIPSLDAEQAFEIYGDPEVMRFLGDGKTASSVKDVRARLEQVNERYAKLNNGTGYWAILEKATGRLVGSVILKQLPDNEEQPTADYEIGWHLMRSHWGKGYATEAGQAALEYGFNVLKQRVIYAVAKPENGASIRVMQRLGMTPLGRTNNYYGVELELFKLDAPGG